MLVLWPDSGGSDNLLENLKKCIGRSWSAGTVNADPCYIVMFEVPLKPIQPLEKALVFKYYLTRSSVVSICLSDATRVVDMVLYFLIHNPMKGCRSSDKHPFSSRCGTLWWAYFRLLFQALPTNEREFTICFLIIWICTMQVLDNLPHNLAYRETPKSPWLETWVVRNQTRSARALWLSTHNACLVVAEIHAPGVPHSNDGGLQQ